MLERKRAKRRHEGRRKFSIIIAVMLLASPHSLLENMLLPVNHPPLEGIVQNTAALNCSIITTPNVI